MSLLLESMEKCVMLDRKTASDGEGGYITEYTEGAEFSAAISFENSVEARIAEAQGVKSLYTVVTEKSFILQYHDVFKRLKDGKIFRATSDGDDKATPSSSTLNMRVVNAEEFKI